MNGRLLGATALALVVLAVFAASLPANASTRASATYFAVSETFGELVITADQGSSFIVRNELPDGSYGVAAKGGIGESESVRLGVPHLGPTANGQPQYIVYLREPSGTWTVILATKPLEEEWWLD